MIRRRLNFRRIDRSTATPTSTAETPVPLEATIIPADGDPCDVPGCSGRLESAGRVCLNFVRRTRRATLVCSTCQREIKIETPMREK